ncbi:nitroreductase family protein [Geoalkalibacter subterraneus]|uniref:Nitroreductase n=1 Tax=Geoalkalibacter subterraneus TaxID=483547 RepID=A0A0B5FRI1_9BACT|nr:nitroreductase family protein [Geoalkalibacter subterraneus]AJF06745.1 nitroreductase [Geoalkalibacter subterraneus]
MDIFQVIRDRRSVRKYMNKEVEQEKVDQVLDAARLAPSWKNMQCWRFLVLRDAARRALLLDAVPDDNPGKKALAAAPLTIVLCVDPRESDVENGIPYYVADGAIAFEHLCLAAHALGLGTCWIGWYDEAKIKEAFGIPDPFRVIGFTPLGYPEREPKPRPRKSLDEIVFYDVWPAGL